MKAWAALTAAKASTIPAPNTLAVVPPQVGAVAAAGRAVSRRMRSVASMLPISLGWADHISATTPAMCGPAIDVPLFEP